MLLPPVSPAVFRPPRRGLRPLDGPGRRRETRLHGDRAVFLRLDADRTYGLYVRLPDDRVVHETGLRPSTDEVSVRSRAAGCVAAKAIVIRAGRLAEGVAYPGDVN